MARNAEKAMTTLARWRAAQVQEAGGQRERRPYLASECNNLQQAEKWRLQIVREIAKKVAQIQNDMDEEQIDATNTPITETLRAPSIRSVNEPDSAVTTDVFDEKYNTPQKSPNKSSPVSSPVHTTPPITSLSPKRSLNASIRSQRSNKNDIAQNNQIDNKSNQDSAANILNKLNLNGRRQLSDEKQKKERRSINMSVKSLKSKKDSLPNTELEYKTNQDVENHDNLNATNDKEANPMLIEKQSEEDNYEKKLEETKSPLLYTNINKIANMSRHLTNEANSLRESIKNLSDNIVRTRQELNIAKDENVNFPYHLFLIELIINKIHMKCDCFEFSYNNLVISATFLGKQPITLYDSSYGKIYDFSHLNVGKSALFAMTYDKICGIEEFIINLNLTKQPPCSNCVMQVAEAKIDCTKEYLTLRDELCKKWTEEQPTDNIMCTTSTPLNKNMCYLRSAGSNNCEFIGMMEVTVRMSFLGKEITTSFSASSKSKCTSVLTKEDNGMSMYNCQNVEMNGQGKILLDENTFTRKEVPKSIHTSPSQRSGSPLSHISSTQGSSKQNLDHPNFMYQHRQDYGPKYNEIFTKMNENELRIRVPKTTKFERTGRYDKIQELCSCENNPYNTGDQIQFELPKDNVYSNEYTHNSNLKYTYNGCDKSCENKNRKIINVTPSNCPVPVNMEKHIHPQKDVFILKIGKKLETKDKKTDLEIELVTPKAPYDKPIENNNISQQCSCKDLKDKSSKSPKKKEKKREKKSKTNLAKKKTQKQKSKKRK